MGTEYAIVHDETNEAYDLGKGPWYMWQRPCNDYGLVCPPKTKEDIRSFLEWWMDNWKRPRSKEDNLWADKLTDRIWQFMESHPGWKIVNDCGDDFWNTKEFYEKYPTNLKCYNQISSRYEILMK
jgi:hypothetical protein